MCSYWLKADLNTIVIYNSVKIDSYFSKVTIFYIDCRQTMASNTDSNNSDVDEIELESEQNQSDAINVSHTHFHISFHFYDDVFQKKI